MNQQASSVLPPTKRRRLDTSCLSLSLLDDMNDVTFQVGNEMDGILNIAANRTIFALQSPVFKAQLYGKFAENKSDIVIKVPNITPYAFNLIKKLFYGESYILCAEHISEVLNASIFYLITKLENDCYNFVQNIDNINDWWTIIKSDPTHLNENIVYALITKSNVLLQNIHEIVGNQANLNQIQSYWLARLIDNSGFVTPNEQKIWEICHDHCYYVSDNDVTRAKEVMDKHFYDKIRFPLIDKQYYFDHIAKSDLLNESQQLTILESFDRPKQSKWCCKPRQPWNHFGLAPYNVKCLKPGDKVMVRNKNGFYQRYDIEIIEFETKYKNIVKSLKFKQHPDVVWIKNMATDIVCDGYLADKQSLQFNPSKFHKMYQHSIDFLNIKEGDRVKYDLYSEEWQTGTVKQTLGIRHEECPLTFWVYYEIKPDKVLKDAGKSHYIHRWNHYEIEKIPS